MICLSVAKNGAHVCTAGMPELMLLSANVVGSRFDADAGRFDVTGMLSLPDSRSAHVYWVSDSVLEPGDRLVFTLIDQGEPDAPIVVKPTDSSDYLREQREYDDWLQGHRGPEPLRPQLRTSLAYQLAIGDREIVAQLPEHDTHMLCTLMWHQLSPEHCRISARSFPCTGGGPVEDQTTWLEGELRLGDSLMILILA